MDRLKSTYVSLYTAALLFAAGHALTVLARGDVTATWLGAGLATVPFAVVLLALFTRRIARTSNHLGGVLVLGAGGAIIATYGAATEASSGGAWLPLVYAWVIGVGGSAAFAWWCSKLPMRSSPVLVVGAPLPDLQLQSTTGEQWTTAELRGKPAIVLFFGGNWCPLSVAQIDELAALYPSLAERGVEVVLISPQPAVRTSKLAAKFNVPFRWAIDHDLAAAAALGIVHKHGLPLGLQLFGYPSDSALPTAIVLDENGEIVLADETDNYRVRPEPETLFAVLDQRKAL